MSFKAIGIICARLNHYYPELYSPEKATTTEEKNWPADEVFFFVVVLLTSRILQLPRYFGGRDHKPQKDYTNLKPFMNTGIVGYPSCHKTFL